MQLNFLSGAPWLAMVTAGSLRADAMAGLTGAAVVLPQAVAFAAIAGLPPEYGLYTAMIPPVVAALFGSSLVMVSGPTTAISAVVFGALVGRFDPGSPEFVQAAILLALMVGLIQLAMALARIGRLAGFVSHSVMIGFTAAAAMLIAVSQLSPALGLPKAHAHGILDSLGTLIGRLGATDGVAVATAGITLVSAVVLRIYAPKWPGFLIAIILGTLFCVAIGDAAADLDYVGALPSAFPLPALPGTDFATMSDLAESAFAIALIGLLEAVAIGRSLARRTRADFSANLEVMGQGLSNLVGGVFQCYPASGSFTRSGVNLEAGATSPLAAIFAALFLVVMVAIFRPFVQLVPIAAIAGLILYVAYRLLDVREFRHLLHTSRTEAAIAALTFGVGLFVSLEFAIYVGTFASLAVFLSKSANPALAIGAPDPSHPQRKLRHVHTFDLDECPATVISRLDGPLFFGSVDAINARFRQILRDRPEQRTLILILQGVGNVDLPGVELLQQEAERRRALGGDLLIVAPYPPLLVRLRKLGLARGLGSDHIFDSKNPAIASAVNATRADVCRGCTQRVFRECKFRPDGPTSTEDTVYD